jgi:protein KRI1
VRSSRGVRDFRYSLPPPKYGSHAEEDDDISDTDSEDVESEDEHGEELTPAVDAAILRTLARIKRKDPDSTDVFEGWYRRCHYATFDSIPSSQRNKRKLARSI